MQGITEEDRPHKTYFFGPVNRKTRDIRHNQHDDGTCGFVSEMQGACRVVIYSWRERWNE